jgi:hypothetical protein
MICSGFMRPFTVAAFAEPAALPATFQQPLIV